jgi:extradiol dioxygenase family protein
MLFSPYILGNIPNQRIFFLLDPVGDLIELQWHVLLRLLPSD